MECTFWCFLTATAVTTGQRITGSVAFLVAAFALESGRTGATEVGALTGAGAAVATRRRSARILAQLAAASAESALAPARQLVTQLRRREDQRRRVERFQLVAQLQDGRAQASVLTRRVVAGRVVQQDAAGVEDAVQTLAHRRQQFEDALAAQEVAGRRLVTDGEGDVDVIVALLLFGRVQTEEAHLVRRRSGRRQLLVERFPAVGEEPLGAGVEHAHRHAVVQRCVVERQQLDADGRRHVRVRSVVAADLQRVGRRFVQLRRVQLTARWNAEDAGGAADDAALVLARRVHVAGSHVAQSQAVGRRAPGFVAQCVGDDVSCSRRRWIVVLVDDVDGDGPLRRQFRCSVVADLLVVVQVRFIDFFFID